MRYFLILLCAVILALPMSAGPASGKDKPVLAATPLSRADLPWWRTRHEAKLAELRQKRPNLIFLGDSITQSWELTGPPDYMNFVPVWQRFYGDRNAVNLGFSGDATAHLLWRIQNGEVAGIAPKVAVVLIGANNLGKLRWSAEDTLAGFDAIVAALATRLPTTKVLLLGILPSDRTDWATATTATVNKALAAKYARHPAVTFLDVGHVFMRNGVLNRDLYYDTRKSPPGAPLHPSAEGQALMAAAMEPTLSTLLGDKPRR